MMRMFNTYSQQGAGGKKGNVYCSPPNVSCVTSHILSNTSLFCLSHTVQVFISCSSTLQTSTASSVGEPARLASGSSEEHFYLLELRRYNKTRNNCRGLVKLIFRYSKAVRIDLPFTRGNFIIHCRRFAQKVNDQNNISKTFFFPASVSCCFKRGQSYF